MATKFKNIVGSAFLPYVADQFAKRSSIVKKNPRTNTDLQFLTNRNGWYRLSSSAQTTDEVPPELKSQDTSFNPIDENLQFQSLSEQAGLGIKNLNENIEKTTTYNNSFTSDIAKNNVLQGGILRITGKENQNTQLRKGFKETYQDGGTDDLGFKPMPGITGITVGTGGKWQTLMQADIEFICYDLDQLNIMSKLYMSLGVTCLLEWGHIPYINNQGTLVNQSLPINFFNQTNKETLAKEIQQKRLETSGNYDGFLGTVYNFNYKADKDGAFLCKVQLMGAGGMVESLKINTNFNIDFTNTQEGSNNDSEKYTNTLDNVLASFSEILSEGEVGALYKKEKGDSKEKTTKQTGSVFQDKFFKNIYPYFPGKEGVNRIWGELLNKIYGECSYTPFYFNADGKTGRGTIDYNNNIAMFGNAHQIISGIFPNPESGNLSSSDDLPIVPLDFYGGFTCWFAGDSDKDVDEIQTYITFGHLLALINSLGIFAESDENKKITPVLYIDYHPDNTEINIGPIIASSNPFTCLVPFSRGSSSYNNFWNPLKTNESSSPRWLRKEKGTISRNLEIKSSENQINKNYPISKFKTEDGKKGKLMNVLININFAREVLGRSTNDANDVNLIEYINKLLDGINESLGGINNLRTFIDECGSVLRIIDEKVPDIPLVKENLIEIPTFGTTSITYDSSYTSAITPKLASQIVIATQASGGKGIKDFSEDVLSYQSLNGGVKDKFSVFKLPAIGKNTEDDKKNQEEQSAKEQKSLLKLYNHFWKIYTFDDQLSPKDCSNLKTSYISLSNQKSKVTSNIDASQSNSKSSILIPLEYSIKIDGMAGILPYNAFKIPNSRLPERYRDKVAFAVFSINHTFEDNNWFTTLRGQTIMLSTPTILEEGVADSPMDPNDINLQTGTQEVEYNINTFLDGTLVNDLLYGQEQQSSTLPGEEDSPAGGISIGNLTLYPPTGNVNLSPERNDKGGAGNFGASRGVRNHKGIDIETVINSSPIIDLLVYPNLFNAYKGLNPTIPSITLKKEGLLSGKGTKIYAPITGKLRNSSIKSTSILPGMAIDGTGEFAGYTVWMFYMAYDLSLVDKIVTKGTFIGNGIQVDLQPGYKGVGNHIHYQIAQKGVKIDPGNFKYQT